MSEPLNKVTKPIRLTFYVLWGAFFISPVIYMAVVFFIQQTNESQENTMVWYDDPFVMTLSIISTICGLSSLILPRIFHKKLPQNTTSDTDLENYKKEVLLSDPRQTNNKQEIEQLNTQEVQNIRQLNAYFVPFLLGLACAESIAVFGLVISFITKGDKLAPMILFGGLAMLLILINFPRLKMDLM